jgi:anti-sigma regulatory factor (Ser/Thr protein kinase)
VKGQRSFELDVRSIRRARTFVADCLRDRVADDLLETIQLVVSELATNSVRHARSAFDVSVSAKKRKLRVEVTDHGTGMPKPRHATPADTSGRGLEIVANLVDHWGFIERPGGGKLVWFEFRLGSAESTPSTARAEQHKAPLSRGASLRSALIRAETMVTAGACSGGPTWSAARHLRI